MLSAAPATIATAAESTPHVVDLQAQFVSSPAHPIHVGKSAADASTRLRISNVGDATAKGSLTTLVYLSTDSTLDGGDALIGGAVAPHAIIKGGKSKVLSARLVFPPGSATGNYHLIAVVDPAAAIPGNIAAGNVLLAPTTITLSLGHPHDHEPDDGGGGTIDDGSGGDDTSTDDGGGNSNTSSTSQPTTSPSDGGSDFGDSSGDDSGGDDGGGDDGEGADF